MAPGLLRCQLMDDRCSGAIEWQARLPPLTGLTVALREPRSQDLVALVDLFSIGDAARFGLGDPATALAVGDFIGQVIQDRGSGLSFTYVITAGAHTSVVGLIQVRQVDGTFETAEWECTVAPSSRGGGVFIEAAWLAASFTFQQVGAHRIESRVPVCNGRANGALRKLGAVQEGLLRRSLRRGDKYLDQALWTVLREDLRLLK
jgi:ribosomal-protein-alanine N-acetyltransferase